MTEASASIGLLLATALHVFKYICVEGEEKLKRNHRKM